MKRAPRLSEIAAVLGVSASTVSRALRRPELVRKETRIAIITAAERAGYTHSPPPPLPGMRTETVGLIVPDLENPFFTVLAKAVMSEVGRQDASLIVADTNEDPLGECEIIERLSGELRVSLLRRPGSQRSKSPSFAKGSRSF